MGGREAGIRRREIPPAGCRGRGWGSVLGRQQDCRRRPVRLGDHSEAFPGRGLVGRKQPVALPQGAVIRPLICRAQFAPIPPGVPGQEVKRELTGLPEGLQGARGGDGLAKTEADAPGTHHTTPARRKALTTVGVSQTSHHPAPWSGSTSVL